MSRIHVTCWSLVCILSLILDSFTSSLVEALHMGLPFELKVSAVSVSRISLKDRAFEEQISNFKPLFALASYPSLFPFTNVWAVVFRTGCTEGRVFGACPVLVLEVGWRQASSSF